MTGPVMIPAIPVGIPNSVYEAVAEAIGDAYDCNRAWSAWSHGTMKESNFSLVAADDDRVEDIAIAAILAWEDHRASAEKTAPAIDLEQFRRFINACGHGAGTSPERKAEADRLLALIDGQKAARRGPDQPDLCDLCRVREEVRSDAEGIPFCQECWDGWQSEEAKQQPTKGEGE